MSATDSHIQLKMQKRRERKRENEKKSCNKKEMNKKISREECEESNI